MAFTPTDPVTARRITDRTTQAIADIRAAATLDELATLRRDWLAYAEATKVCAAIREHVEGAVREVSIEIRARQKADGHTGDRA